MSVQVVSFHCVVKNKLGHVIGTSFNQDVIVSTQKNNKTLRGLIEGLKDLKPGEKRKVSLRADEAYGYYDPKLIINLNSEEVEVSKPVNLGETIVYADKGVERLYRVTGKTEDSLILDGNHPLAGQDLIFEIEAIDARLATPEDLDDKGSANESLKYH